MRENVKLKVLTRLLRGSVERRKFAIEELGRMDAYSTFPLYILMQHLPAETDLHLRQLTVDLIARFQEEETVRIARLEQEHAFRMERLHDELHTADFECAGVILQKIRDFKEEERLTREVFHGYVPKGVEHVFLASA